MINVLEVELCLLVKKIQDHILIIVVWVWVLGLRGGGLITWQNPTQR